MKYLSTYTKAEDLSRARTMAGGKLEYRLALDINYATYLLYNQDKELIKSVAYKFIEDASKIFERDINVKLTVCSILIWDKPEPYSLVSDYDYYNNVYNYWSQNRFEERDAVVGMSARGGWFYGGYRMCTSNFPEPNNPYLGVDLLCHELGHTLGSPHTHNCSWPGGPIDYCEALESTDANCNSNYREYVNGSIMSYCRTVLAFHPYCISLMRDFSEGKINADFKLNPLDKPLSAPGILVLKGGNIQNSPNTPLFEWQSAKGAEQFRLQISRNQSFTNVVEDTLIKQSYFQSAGLGEGSYFARFAASSLVGTSAWSEAVAFSVSPFSENSTAPLFLKAGYTRDGTVSGLLRKYTGVDRYQIEFVDEYGGTPTKTYDFTTVDAIAQAFRFTVVRGGYNNKIVIRSRVGNAQKWSKWSEKMYLQDPWDSQMWRLTNLANTSSSPVIAVDQYKSTLHEGVNQILEIAQDSDFKNLVFRDSVQTNRINSGSTNKVVFVPKLNESTSYFVRSRVSWKPGIYSKWRDYELKTAFFDKRFEFAGLVSESMSSTNYTYGEFLQSRFYKSGETLYVHSISNGYYATSDLKTWRPYTTSSTKGRTPGGVYMFATSTDGATTYVVDSDRALVKRRSEGTYEYYYSPQSFFVQPNTPGWITKDGALLFGTETNGMAYFKDGNWKFYDYTQLYSNRTLCVGQDLQGIVWAVMDGGTVWTFENSQWQVAFTFPYWQTLKGISFDQKGNYYLYGDFGLVKGRKGQSWEFVSQLNGIPIRKVVFDKSDQMWLASYKEIGEPRLQNYALVKLKDQKVTVYSDGLNFLQEQFDLEVFNDKVVVMTSGGEIHTFDETQIQGFDPKESYCPGSEVEISLMTNSTFGADNQIKFELVDANGQITVIETDAKRNANKVYFHLPATVKEGTYQVRTVTSSPEIRSNISKAFRVPTLTVPVVTKESTVGFRAKLMTNKGNNLTYQWKLNGVDIPSETHQDISVYQSGDYSVSITNAEGCISVSGVTAVKIDEPSEVTLLQNSPNPLSSTAEIAFYLPQNQTIYLDIFNSKGQKVKQAVSGAKVKGWHTYQVNGTELSTGVYIYRLTAGSVVKSLKMVKF